MKNTAILIPSYNPGARLGLLVGELLSLLVDIPGDVTVVVVDDGSTDDSVAKLSACGVTILQHETNRGKGAALKTGLKWAQEQGIPRVVTLDADGQHPPREALRLLQHPAPGTSLVLGVRDLVRACAPKPNQWSNRFSNWVISLFAGTPLQDTQCGLRRYPVELTLSLEAPDDGYAYESDLVLRAARRGVDIVHAPIEVIYPPESERLSHFDSVRDPARMVWRVVCTSISVRRKTTLLSSS